MDSNDETKVVPAQIADHPQQERDHEIQTLHEGLETCRQVIQEKNEKLQDLHEIKFERDCWESVAKKKDKQLETSRATIDALEDDLAEMEEQARALADELQKARGEHTREVAALVSQIDHLTRQSPTDYAYLQKEHLRLVEFFRGEMTGEAWAINLGQHGDDQRWSPAQTAIYFMTIAHQGQKS
jgi:hypothetical protein